MSIKKNGPSYVGVGRPIKTNGVSLSNTDNASDGKKLYGSSHAKWGQELDLGDAVTAHPMPVTPPVGGFHSTTRGVSDKGGSGKKG
jgi:hypothetical protein